jgi:hypothetical protein
VIESADGALAVASEERNARYLALGFDPLPFLGRQNLPMSIFTLNALEWLSVAETRALSTGARLDARVRQGEILLASSGEKIDPRANPIALYQGLYRLEGGSEYLAVNLDGGNESNLRERAPIQLHDEPSASAEGSAAALLWRYFLFGALALLMIEWFIHPLPFRRRKAEATR